MRRLRKTVNRKTTISGSSGTWVCSWVHHTVHNVMKLMRRSKGPKQRWAVAAAEAAAAIKSTAAAATAAELGSCVTRMRAVWLDILNETEVSMEKTSMELSTSVSADYPLSMNYVSDLLQLPSVVGSGSLLLLVACVCSRV